MLQSLDMEDTIKVSTFQLAVKSLIQLNVFGKNDYYNLQIVENQSPTTVYEKRTLNGG